MVDNDKIIETKRKLFEFNEYFSFKMGTSIYFSNYIKTTNRKNKINKIICKLNKQE